MQLEAEIEGELQVVVCQRVLDATEQALDHGGRGGWQAQCGIPRARAGE